MIVVLYVVLAALVCNGLALAWLWHVGIVGTPCERHGHRWSTNYTSTRLYLTCDVCGLISPGWDLFGAPDGCQRFARRA